MTGAISPARAALARGDPDRARRLADASAEGRFIVGIADAMQGRISSGIAHLEAAMALGPTAEYAAQLARLLVTVRRDADARAAAETAAALGPADALTFDTIGCVHARLGDQAAALAMFEPAVARAPDNLEFRLNLALALGFVGRAADAAVQHEHIIAQAPGHSRAHLALAGLAKATPAANHIARLEAALAAARDVDDGLRLRHALAKEYEDLGEAAPALRHLQAANAAHKARIGYDFAETAAIFDALEAVFARPGCLAGASGSAEAPIFVTGMPRTGTTLVDRILSSHPDVRSAGELQAMPLAIKQLAATRSRLIIDSETVAAMAGLDPAAVGHAYALRAGEHRQPADGRYIDKLPANFLYIGAIARALPNASIVCLRRHPLDTVWSNYKHLFAQNAQYYGYSYDLMDCARYYARFDQLLAFWERLFPGRVLQLRYEDLVADQEGESRRLFGHCGLDWTDAALDFHRNAAAVATPSAAQVRRPIYRDAVARWRQQAAALAPVKAWLEGQGIATD